MWEIFSAYSTAKKFFETFFNFSKFQFWWYRWKDLNRFERVPLFPYFVVLVLDAFLLTILAFLVAPVSFLWGFSTGLVTSPKPWLVSSMRAYFLLKASVRFLNKIWAAVMWVASLAPKMAFLNAAGVAIVTACIETKIKTEYCMFGGWWLLLQLCWSCSPE